MTGKKRKVKIPRAFLEQLMSEAEEASKESEGMTAQEVFKEHLAHMDKYRDYFFSGAWPDKWDFKYSTTFTREDVDFIEEGEEDYVDRVLTVILKKNVSLKGYNALGPMWTYEAFLKEFVKPDLKKTYETFKELVKTGLSADEILTEMLKQNDIVWIHRSLVELLKDTCCLWDNRPLDLKVSEVLDLIHTKKGYPECEEEQCKRQREKFKKKT